MKKILFVVDERRMGGISILLESILSKLDKKKFKTDVLVLHNNGEMLENLDSDIRVFYGTPYFDAIDYTIKDIIKKKSLSLFIKKFRVVFDMKTGRIKSRIKKERAKILDTEYDVEIAFKDGFTALFTGCGESKRKIHWLHYEYQKLNPNRKYQRVFEEIFPNFALFIAVSENVKKQFNEIYHFTKKTIVIPNLIDPKKIKEKALEACLEEKKQGEKLKLISVGRLHFQKGYDRLLEATKRLKEEGLFQNVEINIYGDGPERETLFRLQKEYQLENEVKFKGQVMNPYPYVKDSDMFLLSSTDEAFGLVIVEAMTLQVPVLATSNAATKELILDHENGMIVENSTDGIYQGLKEVLQNPTMIASMKKQLKKYEYPVSDIVQQIERALEINL